MPEQRRLDRVLDPAYVAELRTRPVEDVQAMKAECDELETELSYVRRLAQARIDILEAERARRASGGSLADLVADLSRILADVGPRPGPAQAHLPQQLVPSAAIEWNRGLEPLVGDATLVRLPDLADDEIVEIRTRLGELEREVSSARRSLHGVMRVIETDLAQRIQATRS